MTISSVNNRAQLRPVKAQAAAPAPAKPKTFSDVQSYESYVSSSEVSKLPAARAVVSDDQAKADAAAKALAARKQELHHDQLASALAAAQQKLDQVSFPLKPQAAQKTQEAANVAAQVGQIDGQIARLQQQIGQAQASKAARNRDAWWGDHSNDTWVDVVIDGAGAIADGSAISSGQKQIQQLITQKTQLQQKALQLTMEATALANQPGDPTQIAAARKVRDDAQAALDAAVAGEAPQQQAVDAANGTLSKDKGEVSRLESLKKDLMDYTKQFGFTTRTSMFFHNMHWKRNLDAFWKQKGF